MANEYPKLVDGRSERANLVRLWKRSAVPHSENKIPLFLCKVSLGFINGNESELIGIISPNKFGVTLEVPLNKKLLPDGLTQENYNLFLDDIETVLGIFGPNNTGNLSIKRGTISAAPILHISPPEGTLPIKDAPDITKVINFVKGIDRQKQIKDGFPGDFKILPFPIR